MIDFTSSFNAGINAFFWLLGLLMMLIGAYAVIVIIAWIITKIAKTNDEPDE